MSNIRTAVRKGFTLVEILIVVVILGILAAIVIPQFSSASQAAQASSLVTQLQSIRSQLELYQLQHGGDYPDADMLFEQLTNFTNEDGTVRSAADADTDRTSTPPIPVFGPYLQKAVTNPFVPSAVGAVVTDLSTEFPITTAGTDAAGWQYNEESGEIRANVPTAVAQEVNFNEADGDVSFIP